MMAKLHRVRKINPAKFDHCIKDVKAKGGAANAYAVCTAAGTRSNPSGEYDAAMKATEDFHGTPAHEVFEISQDIFEHDNLGDCGELVKLEIKSINGGTVTVKNFDGARLAQSPKGYPPQLFIEGGDQEVDLADFDITDPHEIEVLGHLKRVWYYTIKYHLGKDGGEANYKHRFGDNPPRGPLVREVLKGKLPHVLYDVNNKLLSIAGGDYKILPEGIDN